MFHPLCGYSLQKGARFIAIADLVICIVVMTSRLIIYDYMEYPGDDGSAKVNETNDDHVTSKNDHNHNLTSSESSEESTTLNSNITHTQAPETSGLSNTIWITFMFEVVASSVFYFLRIILEVWLCRLLLSAAKNRDVRACKLWFWVRLSMTIFILVFSVSAIVTLRHDWADWALEPINIYRIYELIVIDEFRKEITATSGRVKLRA